jgi:1-acyl-sn-glycerol-3-phosphate acyltransferase
MVRLLIAYILSGFFTTFWGLIGLILVPFSNRLTITIAVRNWGKSMLWAWGIKLEIEGFEKLPQDRSTIIMYNHQSSFDIFAFSAAIPFEWKAIMKKEVLSIPFVGWISKIGGHYFVSRDGSSEDTKEVKKIVSDIKTGPSLILAPEGTRSYDGRLLPFKKGGFLIAMLAGVPVVPMLIWGGKNIKNKKEFKLNSNNTINIKFFDPIDVSLLPRGKKGREELENSVRDSLASEVEKYLAQEYT